MEVEDATIQLLEALESVEQRAEAIVAKFKESEFSINQHFNEIIQNAEQSKKAMLTQLNADYAYYEEVLKKQSCLLRQQLKDLRSGRILAPEMCHTVPMVEFESVEEDEEVIDFETSEPEKLTIRPYAMALDLENSYIDPVSLSGELCFDVQDITGRALEAFPEGEFSVVVDEPQNATTKVEVLSCLSQLQVNILALGKAAASSDLKVTVKFDDIELVDLSKKPITTERVEGEILYNGRLPRSVLRACVYGSEMFCTAEDHVEVLDLFGNLKRSWGSKGAGPGLFTNLWGVTVIEDKVFVADWKQECIQIFDLEGTFLRLIPIERPAYLVVVGEVVWVCTPKPDKKLTILSKDGDVLAEGLNTFRNMFNRWKHRGLLFPFGDYSIVYDQHDYLIYVYDALGNLVFKSDEPFMGFNISISVLPDGKNVSRQNKPEHMDFQISLLFKDSRHWI
jgi:hypothetical protein